MKIRETGVIGDDKGFTPEYTAESIRELEEMRERGEQVKSGAAIPLTEWLNLP